MSKNKFDNTLRDSQATDVEPIKPEDFDLQTYAEYVDELNLTCAEFQDKDSGILVYRRMRVAECFSSGCRDMQASLAAQLGALQKSMDFKADVPNFLEPWYGIGTVASAYGGEYIWHPGEAPAMIPRFATIDEALNADPVPVAETNIGKHTLNMIEYFLEQTKGMIPMSFTDTQSPLNIVTHLLPMDSFLLETIMQPDKVLQLLDRLTDLSIEFNEKQKELIGDALAFPGHGFASSTKWRGLGMSDDNAIMMSPDQYTQLAASSFEKVCRPLGGSVFHSCGNWAPWIDSVLKLEQLRCADGAFSPQTDPGAITDLEAFHKFANTGIVLNVRIVGDVETIEEQVKRLWAPGMKMVVVTYCHTPKDQKKAYYKIYERN